MILEFSVKPLSPDTWPDFAALVERHNGVWGGCWCIVFHPDECKGGDNRVQKERLVCEGKAHAALVYDGKTCVGWCQFGSPDELPQYRFGKAYRAVPTPRPDWRITCFFVDKAYRRKGVAAAALRGALQEIARLGGGTVESYPEEVGGRRVSSSFLFNSAISIFEKEGFERIRPLGKNNWLVTKVVEPSGLAKAG